MPQVDRAGLFRGEIRDHSVTTTNKKKLPQLVVTFLATELYDDVAEIWEDWSEYGQTITAYLVLATLDEHGNVCKCFAYDDIMGAVGWDGVTYASLAAMDLRGKRVQFRVIEDEYEGVVRLKANMIAAEDAEIGLRKLSDKDMAALDAKFAIAAPAKVATPAKAPSKGKAKPKTHKPPKAPTKKAPTKTEDIKPCSEDDAYAACVDANAALAKPVPDEVLDDYWTDSIKEIAEDSDNITGEEYTKIRDAVMVSLNIPF